MLLYLLYSVTDNKYFLSPSLLLNWYCILLLQIMSRVYLSKTPLVYHYQYRDRSNHIGNDTYC